MVEDIEDLVGGVYWSYVPKKIMSILKWTGLMYLRQRQAASACKHKPTDSLVCALRPLKIFVRDAAAESLGYVSAVPCSHSMGIRRVD